MPIQLDRMEILSDPIEDGLRYRLKYNDNLPDGETELHFAPVSSYAGEIVFDIATALELKPDDIIAHITNFFPSGRWGNLNPTPVRQSRQGVGSKILEKIVEDAKSGAAKMIYASTPTYGMTQLLTKRGFTRLNQRKGSFDYFYKMV